jgi:hypothetical protein
MCCVIMTTAASVIMVMLMIVTATASMVMVMVAVTVIIFVFVIPATTTMIEVMSVIVLTFVASAATGVFMSTVVVRVIMIVVMIVIVIAAATAVIVLLVSMSGRVLGWCGRYGRCRQFRDIEPERPNFLGNVLRRCLAGDLARQSQGFGGEINGNVGDSPHTAQGGLDLSDAACAIHAADMEAEPFAGIRS